jgi:hypothetical protein
MNAEKVMKIAPFLAGLRPSQLPGRAAWQLPDQSTIIRVRPSLTDGLRPWADHFRGRDASYLAPPAHIRTSPIRAYGSHLGCVTARRDILTKFRMRSSACDTVPRYCARPVLCWLTFPSAPPLAPPTPQNGFFCLFLKVSGKELSRLGLRFLIHLGVVSER